jgi:hypothetical protein
VRRVDSQRDPSPLACSRCHTAASAYPSGAQPLPWCGCTGLAPGFVLIGWPDRGSESDCAAGLTAMTPSLSVRIAMPRSLAEARAGQAQICLVKRGMRE